MTALDKLCTPPNVLELVRKVGRIGVDVFPGEHAMVNPRITLPADWDAYESTEWTRGVERDEVVWIQPPYSRGHLPRVASIWSQQGFANPRRTSMEPAGIALLPSSTGANWFDVMCRYSRVLVLWRGRITFWLDGKPTGGSGWFDSALFYNGPNPYRFADVFAAYGRVVML